MIKLVPRTCVALMLLAVPVSAGDSQTDDLKREIERHQGTWAVTSFVRDGKESARDLVDSIVRIVKGDHVVWKRDGKSFAGTTVELDPSQTPKTIDVIPDGGRARGERVLGIYQLDADSLVICMADAGKERPKSFEAPAGGKLTLIKFQRTASGKRL